MSGLTPIDLDLIAFLAERRRVAPGVVQAAYATAKARFGFTGQNYKSLIRQLHALHAPLYGRQTDAEVIEAYRFHALPHLYRLISYSYGNMPRYQRQAKTVLSYVRDQEPPIMVLDYGAGLGHLSAAIAQACPAAFVYLLDLNCLTLDFAEFRFRKLNIPHEVIRVTEHDLYPQLPAHDVCIIAEVMEHLRDPMVAYENILEAMVPDGILTGTIGNRGPSFFHLSPNLSKLKARIRTDFEVVDKRIWRKRTDA